MIKLKKPEINMEDIINDCLSNVKKEPTLSNITNSKNAIIFKSEKYDELGNAGQLDILQSHVVVEGGATKDDMVWLYDNKFVAGGGRKYYNKIKAIPKYERCPFCGVGRVSTLDHYLPKTEYPTYAITPCNLVASCADCNKKKSVMVIQRREEELIHPYYDDFDDEIWLKVRIQFEDEVIFNFFVEKPESWNKEKYERAKNHFVKLGLNALYISQCSEEFAEYYCSAKRIFKIGGNELIKADLYDRVRERRSITKNNWKAALYQGLLDNEEGLYNYLTELSHN